MLKTDDPHRDFVRDDARKAKWLDSRPICTECDEPIQEESAYYIHDGWICEQCVKECRKAVD